MPKAATVPAAIDRASLPPAVRRRRGCAGVRAFRAASVRSGGGNAASMSSSAARSSGHRDRRAIGADVAGIGRFRNRDDVRGTQQPASASCAGVAPSAPGDRRELRLAQQRALSQRRVRHHRNPALAQPRQQLPFDAALAQVVEDLVGRAVPAVGQRDELAHVGDVEVRHAPAHDLAVARAAARTRRPFPPSGIAPAPVQQIEIEAIGAQAPRGCARRQRLRFFGRRCADRPC